MAAVTALGAQCPDCTPDGTVEVEPQYIEDEFCEVVAYPNGSWCLICCVYECVDEEIDEDCMEDCVTACMLLQIPMPVCVRWCNPNCTACVQYEISCWDDECHGPGTPIPTAVPGSHRFI